MPGRRSWPSLGIVAYSFVATILPVGALVIVSLSKFWSADIDVAGFTLDNFRQVFDESGITGAIATSISISLAGRRCDRHPARLLRRHAAAQGTQVQVMRPIVDFIVAMPLGVPGGGLRRRLPADLHPGAVRPLRHAVGDHPRLRDADAAVHHPDAAGRDGRARQHVPRGVTNERGRCAADQPQQSSCR